MHPEEVAEVEAVVVIVVAGAEGAEGAEAATSTTAAYIATIVATIDLIPPKTAEKEGINTIRTTGWISTTGTTSGAIITGAKTTTGTTPKVDAETAISSARDVVLGATTAKIVARKRFQMSNGANAAVHSIAPNNVPGTTTRWCVKRPKPRPLA